MTPDSRWQALRDYLGGQINEHRGLADECRAAGERSEAAMWNALVRADRATLAKMTELETPR